MTANLLLVIPLLLPLIGAVACVLLWRHLSLQILIVAVVQLCLIAASANLLHQVEQHGILATQIGNWPAPFGISLVADVLCSLLLLTTCIVGLAVFMFSNISLGQQRKRFGFYPLFLLLQMGISGASLTGDVFNLYVWFEVILICSFALIALGNTKGQLEGALKYVTINLIASGLLLTGIGALYTLYGALNMASLAEIVRSPHQNLHLLGVPAVFLLTGFGIKAAIFPLFFWLPASYHVPPIAISAFIAGIVTKIGIYTLVRLYCLIFSVDHLNGQPLLLILSGLTMGVGVIGAVAQTDFRKILSFHIISQIGYMLMGLAIFTPLALAGSIFFIVHNMLVKTNLFLVSGAVATRYQTFALSKLGGVYLKFPILALLFLFSALSLAGLPPLSGFWGKLMLAYSGIASGNIAIVVVSLCVSLVTLLSMTKIWNEVFWKKIPDSNLEKELPEPRLLRPSSLSLYSPILFLLAFILALGFHADPIIKIAQDASEQLLHSEMYIRAVLK